LFALASSPIQQHDASNHSAGGGQTTRVRINSRDIARTYSGLYGSSGDDLLPFELSRNGTLTTVFKRKQQGVILGLYVSILILTQVIVGMILNVLSSASSSSSSSSSTAASSSSSSSPSSSISLLDVSWTCTNVLHTAISLIYIHWMKGSCLYPADDNGEMNGLTLWEQLDATPDTRALREALMVVPCLLTWIACHATDYQWTWSLLNCALWIAAMLGKLPCMNGVRIFGINRTVGIDDDLFGMGDDDDDDDDGDDYDNMDHGDDLDRSFQQHQPTTSTTEHQLPIRDRSGSSSSRCSLLGIDEKKSQ
jgi:ORMDL family